MLSRVHPKERMSWSSVTVALSHKRRERGRVGGHLSKYSCSVDGVERIGEVDEKEPAVRLVERTCPQSCCTCSTFPRAY